MKKIILAVVTISLFACSANDKQAGSTEEQNFEQFKVEFVEALWKANPIWASYEGYHKYDDQLPLPNDENRSMRLAFMNEWSKKISQFDYNLLAENDQIDYYLIRDYLNSIGFYINDFKEEEWNPASYNLGGAFFQVINYQGDSLNKRLRNIDAKLDGLEEYYREARHNINRPTEVHTALAIQQLEGSKRIFVETIMDSLEVSSIDDANKAVMAEKINESMIFIDEFISYLKEEYEPHFGDTAGTIFRSHQLDQELYRTKFNYQIQSTYSAEEIFEAAVEEKQYLHDQLYRLSETLWEQYYGDQEKPGGRFEQIQLIIDAVANEHVHRDSFVTAIRQQIPILQQFVIDNDLLTLDPEKPLIVRETPEYMRGFSVASISAPGPYDSDAETFYNVSPLDDYTKEQAESHLREYNNYTLQILNIHEAIPGHYTQLVYSNESPSIIKSILGNGAMIEGWAVYAERMMLENEYGGDQMEIGLMYYKWFLRTVCNTILDYGIHIHNFSEEEAMQLLMKEAFQEQAEANGKWRRARLSQVQLCSYFTGYFEIMQLRDEIMELEGENFNLKEFHEEFLSYGSAPVKYIRKLMIAKRNDQNQPS